MAHLGLDLAGLADPGPGRPRPAQQCQQSGFTTWVYGRNFPRQRRNKILECVYKHFHFTCDEKICDPWLHLNTFITFHNVVYNHRTDAGRILCLAAWFVGFIEQKISNFTFKVFMLLKFLSLEKCRSGSLFWLGVVSPKQRRICLHPRDSLLVKESLGRKQVLGSFGKRLHFWSVVLNGVIDTLRYYYQSFMKHGAGGLEMVALRAAISIWQLSTHGWPNH